MPEEIDTSNRCSICLSYIDTNTDRCTTRCNHIFHSSCLLQAAQTNLICPLCRNDLITIDVPPTQESIIIPPHLLISSQSTNTIQNIILPSRRRDRRHRRHHVNTAIRRRRPLHLYREQRIDQDLRLTDTEHVIFAYEQDKLTNNIYQNLSDTLTDIFTWQVTVALLNNLNPYLLH